MATKLPLFRSQLVFENRIEEQLPAQKNKLVTEHPFNFAAEVFVPGPLSSIEEVQNQMPDGAVYFKAKVPLANFLRIEFIDNHLRKGCLHGVTVGCGVDREDCAALMPNGDLIMSLTKDTYLELGLEGKPSTVQPGARHIVELNLTADYCRPDKKYYKRALWCLTDRLQLVFPFVLAYSNQDAVSAERLSQDLGVECTQCTLQRTHRTWYNLNTPALRTDVLQYPATQTRGGCTSSGATSADASTPSSESGSKCKVQADAVTEDDVTQAAVQFHEWLGAMLCGIKLEDSASGVASSLASPSDPVHVPECTSVRWTGCVSAQSISSALGALRSQVASGDLAWAGLCVWGFHDSPVSWRGKEHGHGQSGDNQYTLVLLPHGRYWVFATSPS